MPYRSRSALRTRATWGSMSLPVRSGADSILLNDPDGWVSEQGRPAWWLGLADGTEAAPSAEALPVTIRATSLVADPLVSDPFRVTERAGGGAPLPPPRWITDPMLLRPDERFPGVEAFLAPAPLRLPRSAFWRQWVVSALWYGLGMIVAQRASNGQPVSGTMRVLHPSHVQPYRRPEGDLVWRIGSEESWIETGPGGDFDLGAVRYMTLPLRNPHSPIGPDGFTEGVFGLAPSAFAMAGRVDGYSRGVFRSGVPSGYLKATQPGLTQEQADTLKAKWMAAHGRDQRSIAVLNSTTEFHPLTLSPVDSALAEVKRLAIADVAYAFGIAPEVLGVTMGNSATYSNLTQWFRAHRDFGLSPWVDAIGGTLTAVLPGETGVSVNLDGFERPDLSERLANYERALSMGLYTLEEARAMESLPPLPRGASNAVQGPQAQGVPPVEDRQRGGPSGGVQPDQEEGGGLRPDQAEG